MDILYNAARYYHEKALIEKEQRRLSIENRIDESDKKIFLKRTKRSIRRYNLTQTAHILKVHRQTIYYWINQKKVKPKRDFRGYPVFTVLDIEKLIEWKETVKC